MVQLYEILKLRAEVFVVEQTCVYNDVDGADPVALHLLGYHQHENAENHSLAAYCRVFSPSAEHVHARGKMESNIGV